MSEGTFGATARRAAAVLPRVLLAAVIAAAPLSVMVAVGPPLLPGLAPGYAQPVVELSEWLALLACIAVFGRRRGAAPGPPPRFTHALTALAVLALATAPFALSPGFAAFTALRWALIAAVATALVRTAFAPADAALVLVVALLPHIVAALGQAVLQRPLGWPAEATLPLSVPDAPVITVPGGRWLRPFGLTFHPNVLGGYCAVAIVLVMPLLWRRAVQAAWAGLWAALFLTFSRSAWLASAVAVGVTGAARWRAAHPRRWHAVAALLGAAVLAAAAWPLRAHLATRLSPLHGAERQSLADRVEMAAIAWRVIRADPLVGIGAGNFPLVMARQPTQLRPQYVHAVPLLLAAEIGVLGGAVWCAAWIAGWVALLRRWRAASPELVAALAAWCGLGLIGLADCYPWSLQSGRLLTAITLALLDVAWARDEPLTVPDGRAAPAVRAR